MKTLRTVKTNEQLIYDVGMHKGEDTDFYLRCGFDVVAFEADPELVKRARMRFADAIDRGTLSIVEGAIVEHSGRNEIPFYRNLDLTEWGTVDEEWAQRNIGLGSRLEMITVEPITFEKCIEQYGVPHYMKIDIEGADRVCLQALRGFDRKPSYLSIESNKLSVDSVYEELSLLEDLGYTEFMAVQQAWMERRVVEIETKNGTRRHQFEKGASGPFGAYLEGEWLSKEDVMEKYKTIINLYRSYGDNTIWQKNRLARSALGLLSGIMRTPVPGWYDTHARLPPDQRFN